MKPFELGPLLKEKIKHLKTVLFSVAHHDLPFAVPNAVLIVHNPIAIKSSDGRGEQEDHHDDNCDGQLGQEGGIHFSHKLQKGEKKFIHFVIMVYPAVSKITLARISLVEKEDPKPSGIMTSTDPLSPWSSFPIFMRKTTKKFDFPL